MNADKENHEVIGVHLRSSAAQSVFFTASEQAVENCLQKGAQPLRRRHAGEKKESRDESRLCRLDSLRHGEGSSGYRDGAAVVYTLW
jgi:hypothetical protein